MNRFKTFVSYSAGFSSQFATENSFASAFGNTSNKSTNGKLLVDAYDRHSPVFWLLSVVFVTNIILLLLLLTYKLLMLEQSILLALHSSLTHPLPIPVPHVLRHLAPILTHTIFWPGWTVVPPKWDLVLLPLISLLYRLLQFLHKWQQKRTIISGTLISSPMHHLLHRRLPPIPAKMLLCTLHHRSKQQKVAVFPLHVLKTIAWMLLVPFERNWILPFVLSFLRFWRFRRFATTRCQCCVHVRCSSSTDDIDSESSYGWLRIQSCQFGAKFDHQQVVTGAQV